MRRPNSGAEPLRCMSIGKMSTQEPASSSIGVHGLDDVGADNLGEQPREARAVGDRAARVVRLVHDQAVHDGAELVEQCAVVP